MTHPSLLVTSPIGFEFFGINSKQKRTVAGRCVIKQIIVASLLLSGTKQQQQQQQNQSIMATKNTKRSTILVVLLLPFWVIFVVLIFYYKQLHTVDLDDASTSRQKDTNNSTNIHHNGRRQNDTSSIHQEEEETTGNHHHFHEAAAAVPIIVPSSPPTSPPTTTTPEVCNSASQLWDGKFAKKISKTISDSNSMYIKSPHPPRYDHTCFIMKPRYNCAKPSSDFEFDYDVATDYHLVFKTTYHSDHHHDGFSENNNTKKKKKKRKEKRRERKKKKDSTRTLSSDIMMTNTNGTTTTTTTTESSESSYCDLRHIVDTIGGPAGIAQRLIDNKKKAGTTTDDDVDSSQTDLIHVVIQGTSHLRQIFEALVCGFSNEITDIKLQIGGPDTSVAALKKRGDKKVSIDELGTTLHGLDDALQGCHSRDESDISQFYRKGVEVPTNIPNCNDDIAMVEFSGLIRFYYLFRPILYDEETLEYVHHEILNIPNEIDLLMYNFYQGKNNMLPDGTNAITSEYFQGFLQSSFKLQKQHLGGKYFGADNPWITNPPDKHACMPGIPDDLANLLLYYLLAQSGS